MFAIGGQNHIGHPRHATGLLLAGVRTTTPNMSANTTNATESTQQQTLDGGTYDPTSEWRPPRNGVSIVLWYADPDTEFSRLAAWANRLKAEDLI